MLQVSYSDFFNIKCIEFTMQPENAGLQSKLRINI
jgi:hypothetical protein